MKKKIKFRKEFLLLLPLALLLLLKLFLADVNARKEAEPVMEKSEQTGIQEKREIPRDQLRDFFNSVLSEDEPQEETLSDDDPEID